MRTSDDLRYYCLVIYAGKVFKAIMIDEIVSKFKAKSPVVPGSSSTDQRKPLGIILQACPVNMPACIGPEQEGEDRSAMYREGA